MLSVGIFRIAYQVQDSLPSTFRRRNNCGMKPCGTYALLPGLVPVLSSKHDVHSINAIYSAVDKHCT